MNQMTVWPRKVVSVALPNGLNSRESRIKKIIFRLNSCFEQLHYTFQNIATSMGVLI